MLAGCGGASSQESAKTAAHAKAAHDDSIAELASHEGIASLDGEKPQGNVAGGSSELHFDLVDKDSPINLDGVPKEWTLVPALSAVKGSAEGVTFKCGLAYDARTVYFAGDVTGIKLRHLRRFTSDEDHATLDLVAPGGAPVEVTFFPGKPGDITGVVRIHGRGVPGAKIVEAEKDNGYTFEASIP